MALQDLTPQLRTRLSRVERIVGVFVLFATLLLLAGFAYYIYATAQRKGWFLTKVGYQTSINNAAGLKEGDPVKLMGFTVGEITDVIPNEPGAYYNVTVFFNIRDPNFGYIWTDSKVKVAAADFLGNRYLEVTKGIDGIATVHQTTNNVVRGILDQNVIKAELQKIQEGLKQTSTNQSDISKLALETMKQRVRGNPDVYYINYKTNRYWMTPLESPALTDRLEEVVNVVTNALPNVFYLTNQIAAVLSNVASATSQLEKVLATTKPMLTNVTEITANIKDPNGSLGNWLIPTNLNQQLNHTLASTDQTLESVQTNLVILVRGIDQTLMNLANITSNLNNQVESNPTLVSNISSTIVNANEMVQGLKRHWLLRSAFKTNKTEKVSPSSRPKTSLGTPRSRK
jgi:ABC-type transporter Mla subunit MlaD